MRQQAPAKSALYLGAIVALTITAAVSVVVVVSVREGDNSAVIASILGIITPTILTLLGFMQRDTHQVVNSRMDDFKQEIRTAAEISNTAAFTEGVAQGKVSGAASANKRTDDLSGRPT